MSNQRTQFFIISFPAKRAHARAEERNQVKIVVMGEPVPKFRKVLKAIIDAAYEGYYSIDFQLSGTFEEKEILTKALVEMEYNVENGPNTFRVSW